MSSNYFYDMTPGARLEIGPGGRPEESMGACCSSCAQTGTGADAPAQTSVLYKFGMSPLLWAGAAAAGVGAVLYFRRRNRKNR